MGADRVAFETARQGRDGDLADPDGEMVPPEPCPALGEAVRGRGSQLEGRQIFLPRLGSEVARGLTYRGRNAVVFSRHRRGGSHGFSRGRICSLPDLLRLAPVFTEGRQPIPG